MELKEVVDRVWGKCLQDEDEALYSTDEKELICGPRPRKKGYVIREGTEKLCQCAFKDNFHITSVKFPDSLVSLGSWTFENCHGLTSIEVPKGVTQLEERVFKNCKNLRTIKVPAHITSIGQQAFECCENLSLIEFIDYSLKGERDRSFDEHIYFSSGGKLRLPDGIISIGKDAFNESHSVRTVLLPPTPHGVFLQDIVDITGCDVHTVYLWALGRQEPNILEAKAIAKAFGTDWQTLFPNNKLKRSEPDW